jgi:hypothetical protein
MSSPEAAAGTSEILVTLAPDSVRRAAAGFQVSPKHLSWQGMLMYVARVVKYSFYPPVIVSEKKIIL